MADFDSDFKSVLDSEEVPEVVRALLKEAKKFTSKAFVNSFRNLEILDRFFLKKGVESGKVSSLEDWEFCDELAKLRAVQVRLNADSARAQSAPTPLGGQLGTNAGSAVTSKKLDHEEFVRLKQSFETRYPAEVVLPSNTPGKGVLRQVQEMLKPSVGFHILALTVFLSVADEEDRKKEEPANKDASQAEEEKWSGGLYKLRKALDLRARAFAMVGACHLVSWNMYIPRLCEMVSEKLDSTSLRPPSVEEALQADKRAMRYVFQLVNEEKGWTLDKALADAAGPKGVLAQWLQPRPKLPAPPPAIADSRKRGPPGDWGNAGPVKKPCFQYRNGTCTYGRKCKFQH